MFGHHRVEEDTRNARGKGDVENDERKDEVE